MEATYVKDLNGWQGDAKLYRLSESVEINVGFGDDEEIIKFDHIAVSVTSVAFSGPETYIFPYDPSKGDEGVIDWGELPGSFRGGFGHQEAVDGFLERFGDDD